MCGIVGAIATENIVNLLVEGLQHLEYRGYDSAGVAIIDDTTHKLVRVRCLGKVQELSNTIANKYPTLSGYVGIAHTRWATHGEPSEVNAHPHISHNIVIVHNGIIENHEELRVFLIQQGYEFKSQTDTEVIAHLVHYFQQGGNNRLVPVFGEQALVKLQVKFGQHLPTEGNLPLLTAVQMAVCVLVGAYGMVVLDTNVPDALVATRSGSPLVIGLGSHGNYLASDQLALIDKTRKFVYLDEGDVAHVTRDQVVIYDAEGQSATREVITSDLNKDATGKGAYDYYMLKEIYEQPQAIIDSLEGRIAHDHVLVDAIGIHAHEILEKVQNVKIIACGTSYHAGLVAKYWIENYAGINCDVEIASEYRYRNTVTAPNSLILTLSQSGETADTLAALRKAKSSGFIGSMTICNVASSSLVRESDLIYLTRCGVEIGVASTKAFTSQLTLLLLFTIALGSVKGNLAPATAKSLVQCLQRLPEDIAKLLQEQQQIADLAKELTHVTNALFIARDSLYPIAREADLKLKELSYVHSEAFAGGELKHGPLALIDANMTVFALCPNNQLSDKMRSNIEEVLARKGRTIVFTDNKELFVPKDNLQVLQFPSISEVTSPIYYAVAYQLLAFYMAVDRGRDVDQPRNLAKSVTVE